MKQHLIGEFFQEEGYRKGGGGRMFVHLGTRSPLCCGTGSLQHLLPSTYASSTLSSRVTLFEKLPWSLHSSPSHPEAKWGILLWDPINLVYTCLSLEFNSFHNHLFICLSPPSMWVPWDRRPILVIFAERAPSTVLSQSSKRVMLTNLPTAWQQLRDLTQYRLTGLDPCPWPDPALLWVSSSSTCSASS